MATEKELGYEPSLLVEMISDRQDGRIVNVALVQKDRSDTLNGQELRMPKYETFASHFRALNIGGEHFDSMQQRDSQGMFEDADEAGWDKEKRQREIWCEEIQGVMSKRWPGQTGAEKQAKLDALEAIFQTRSWTKVESTSSDRLQAGYHEMRKYIADLDEKPAAAA